MQTLNRATSPIDRLVEDFGASLQHLCDRHKRFMLAALSYQLFSSNAMSDVIDQLDPDALIPDLVTDAIESLDGLPEVELLNLMEAIVSQLRSEGK